MLESCQSQDIGHVQVQVQEITIMVTQAMVLGPVRGLVATPVAVVRVTVLVPPTQAQLLMPGVQV